MHICQIKQVIYISLIREQSGLPVVMVLIIAKEIPPAMRIYDVPCCITGFRASASNSTGHSAAVLVGHWLYKQSLSFYQKFDQVAQIHTLFPSWMDSSQLEREDVT